MIIPLLYAIVFRLQSFAGNKFGMMALFDLFWFVYFLVFSVFFIFLFLFFLDFLTEAILGG